MAGWLSNSLGRARFSTSLLMTFALIALVLAATGVYGVMSYFIAERGREIAEPLGHEFLQAYVNGQHHIVAHNQIGRC